MEAGHAYDTFDDRFGKSACVILVACANPMPFFWQCGTPISYGPYSTSVKSS